MRTSHNIRLGFLSQYHLSKSVYGSEFSVNFIYTLVQQISNFSGHKIIFGAPKKYRSLSPIPRGADLADMGFQHSESSASNKPSCRWSSNNTWGKKKKRKKKKTCCSWFCTESCCARAFYSRGILSIPLSLVFSLSFLPFPVPSSLQLISTLNGYNELPSIVSNGWWGILRDNMKYTNIEPEV